MYGPSEMATIAIEGWPQISKKFNLNPLCDKFIDFKHMLKY